jgi:hypothetical protein
MMTAAVLLVFDGRDVTDAASHEVEVAGYMMVACPVCGTERDARYPYCCELAVFATTERVPVTA